MPAIDVFRLSHSMTFLPDLTSGQQGRGAARGGQLAAAGFAPQAAAVCAENLDSAILVMKTAENRS
jgi:hypothetical protein